MGMTTEETTVLFAPANEIQASGAAAMLKEAHIDTIVVPNEDTAYPGVTDRTSPWGVVRVRRDDLDLATKLLGVWLEAKPEDIEKEEIWSKHPEITVHEKNPRNGYPKFLLGLGVGIILTLIVTSFLPAGKTKQEAKTPLPSTAPVQSPEPEVDSGATDNRSLSNITELEGWFKEDTNGDGQPDEWAFFENNQLVKLEIDANYDGKRDSWSEYKNNTSDKTMSDCNFDGKADEWTYYNETGRIRRIESDMNYDNKLDAWENYENSQFVSGEYDLDYDGDADTWSYSENGQIKERHWSSAGNGKIDRKSFYKKGLKSTEELDMDGDSVFELRRYFNQFGVVTKEEPIDPQ